MIILLLIGCGLLVLYICAITVECLVLLKFGLVVSLPGGLVAQEMSANSQPVITVAVIWQAFCINMTVNLMQLLGLYTPLD